MLQLAFVDPNGENFSPTVRREAQRVADQVEIAVRGHLPALASEIVVLVSPSAQPMATGDNGASVRDGLVHWIVDPSRGVEDLVRERLRPTLYHELHHQARGWLLQGGDKKGTTFMRAVVAEGLATAFERESGDAASPWGDYPSDVRTWVDELLTLPLDADYARWMFQHPDGRRWIGYRAGTFIADEARRLSGRSAANLVTADAADVLRLAGIT